MEKNVLLVSGGTKYNMPVDADKTFDARTIRENPFNLDYLKNHTGMDAEVIEYMDGSQDAQNLVSNVCSYVIEESKKNRSAPVITVAVFCFGGRHRSVYVVEKCTILLHDQGFTANALHRDLDNHLGKMPSQ